MAADAGPGVEHVMKENAFRIAGLFILLLCVSGGLYLALLGAGMPEDILRLVAVALLGLLSGGTVFLIARLVSKGTVKVDFVVSTVVGLITTFAGFFFVPAADSDPVPPPPIGDNTVVKENTIQPPAPPQYLVLTMGVTHYKEGGSLKAGESDANLIGGLLGRRPGVRVRPLLGAHCTKSGIERFIAEQLATAGDNTILIVFISMRGVSYTHDQASGYLIPFDAPIDESTEFPFVRSQGYKILALLQAIHASNVSRALVMVDSCNGYFRNFDETERASTANPRKNVYVVAGPREGWQTESMEQTQGSLAVAVQKLLEKGLPMNCTQLGPEVYTQILEAYSETLPARLYPWHGFWSGNQDFSLPGIAQAKVFPQHETLPSPLPIFVLASSLGAATSSTTSVEPEENGPSTGGYIPTIPEFSSVSLPPEIHEQVVSLQRDPSGAIHEEVIASAKQMLEQDSANPFGHYLLAHAYSDNEATVPDALSHARIAAQLEPLLGGAYGLMGYCEAKLGHFEAAIEAADESVRLLPDDPNAWNGLGYALRKCGESPDSQLSSSAKEKLFQDAIITLNRAISLSGGLEGLEGELVGAYYFNRGRCFHGLKMYTEAIQDYEKSLEYKASRGIKNLRIDSLAAARAKVQPPTQ
ncbi:MAG: hypothetical protein AMXMBFR84_42530 [Candidatus Hydrogenedentota bacterium]